MYVSSRNTAWIPEPSSFLPKWHIGVLDRRFKDAMISRMDKTL
ncbi:hypothetical protein BLIJ_0765 [Bifidobacterium longum subsp. infantis ATCC 15697 = JCM 1222 = DSM 20088]|nr:hypothetical protein BLIJ_0765 [Bifidobacterium longum subsp. infantis ATCC 15697 = JCM 1222 = DSM 20088]